MTSLVNGLGGSAGFRPDALAVGDDEEAIGKVAGRLVRCTDAPQQVGGAAERMGHRRIVVERALRIRLADHEAAADRTPALGFKHRAGRVEGHPERGDRRLVAALARAEPRPMPDRERAAALRRGEVRGRRGRGGRLAVVVGVRGSDVDRVACYRVARDRHRRGRDRREIGGRGDRQQVMIERLIAEAGRVGISLGLSLREVIPRGCTGHGR